MSKKKILIYDDNADLSKKYNGMLSSSEAIVKKFDIKSLDDKKFEIEMRTLKKRNQAFRNGERWVEGKSKLDNTSIFIIDYHLVDFAGGGALLLSGEDVSYFTRCFSGCDLIIGLNQYGTNDFDLTLKGHMESFADLNMGWKQLTNPGLWGEDRDSFRPWHWPQLPNYLDSFEKKIDEIEKNPKGLIWKTLGVPEKEVKVFPKSVNEFLGGIPLERTFSDFVMESGNGLRGRDMEQKPSNRMVARIAAARISKWLERKVTPGQDILVDAPHLVSRYPSLLQRDISNKETWNKSSAIDSYGKLGLDHKKIERFRFKKEHWLSRPMWFWNGVSNHPEIPEVSEPWEREKVPYLFCEDASRFYKRRDCKEFLAESESPYVRRFVRYFSGVNYRPKVRFSL